MFKKNIQTLALQIQLLPLMLQKEVEDFVMYLNQKKEPGSSKVPTFSWADGFEKWGKKHTSVELQHKISDWRIQNEMSR